MQENNIKIISKNTLVNDDSLIYLKSIKDKSIDFVCIDPPYELDNHGGGKKTNTMIRNINDLHIDYISKGFDINNIFIEIERISKSMNMICFCSNKQISKIMNYWEQKKYSVTLLVWEKPNPIPFGNGKHVSNIEFMVYVRGKNVTFNNLEINEKKKTFNYPSPNSKKRLHPTEKPLELLERLIRLHSNENDVVLDCFAGSFSTAEACKNLNRYCISIEIDKNYYNKGIDRLNKNLNYAE